MAWSKLMILDNRTHTAVRRENTHCRGAEFMANAVTQRRPADFRRGRDPVGGSVCSKPELPPTFGPRVVSNAVHLAKEGVEDIQRRGCLGAAPASGHKDIVIGISASGITPFVRGAVTRARGARCVIGTPTSLRIAAEGPLTCLRIVLSVGPEVMASDEAQGGHRRQGLR